MKNIPRYFIQGLFYTVPLGLTIYFVISSIIFLDELIPIDIPGIGILIILVFIVIMGYLGSVVLESQLGFLVRYFEGIILKIPFVKMIYTALKDIASALMGNNRTFDQGVIVTLDKANGIQKIGFVTKSNLTALGLEEGKVAVYFPFSYGIMGDLRIVPKESVKPLEGKPADIMKFVVSGGMIQIEEKRD